jgi:3-oxoadipate CoA-transferase beta subunit
MMEHTTKSGEPKIVERCAYPLTGLGCVKRVYTELAVLDITPEGVQVLEMAEGVAFDELQKRTGVALGR